MKRASHGLVGMVAAATLVLAGLASTTATAAAADVGPDPSSVITFLVGLPHPDKKLDAAAKEASTPGTPEFRR